MSVENKFAILLVLFVIVPAIGTEVGVHHQPQHQPEEEESSQFSESEPPSVTDREIEQAEKLGVNFEKSKQYSFSMNGSMEFIYAVDTDLQVKGHVSSYKLEDNVYVEVQEDEYERTRFVIMEDDKKIVYDKVYFHMAGFELTAKKGHDYYFKFFKEGKTKLLTILMQTSPLQEKTSSVLSTDLLRNHQNRTEAIRGKLTTLLNYVEQTAMINERIAYTVKEKTKMYMYYQVFETVFVLILAFTQVFLIRRMLNKNSVV